MRRVAAGEASQFDGVLHKGLPLRVLSNNDLILKHGYEDWTESAPTDNWREGAKMLEGGEEGEGGGPEKEDHAMNLCRYLSMAISCALELGDDDLEAELADLHTRCEEQYGVDTYAD